MVETVKRDTLDSYIQLKMFCPGPDNPSQFLNVTLPHFSQDEKHI